VPGAGADQPFFRERLLECLDRRVDSPMQTKDRWCGPSDPLGRIVAEAVGWFPRRHVEQASMRRCMRRDDAAAVFGGDVVDIARPRHSAGRPRHVGHHHGGMPWEVCSHVGGTAGRA